MKSLVRYLLAATAVLATLSSALSQPTGADPCNAVQYQSIGCLTTPQVSHYETRTRPAPGSNCACLRWVNSNSCDRAAPTEQGIELCANVSKVQGPVIGLLRLAPVNYADNISVPYGADLKTPREISNIVGAQSESILNSKNVSDFFWQWGQWIDHDFSLTTTNSSEIMNIPVASTDTKMDPTGSGRVTLPFKRSNCFEGSGTNVTNCRRQYSVTTPILDCSQVYGSEPGRTTCLRAWNGVGELRTSAGNMLPYDRASLPQAEDPDKRPVRQLFVAGDMRTNEHVGLTALHTLFMREHNRIATAMHAAFPALSDNQLFRRASAVVIAESQRITYEDWLPLLLGPNALPPYTGYNSSVNTLVAFEFSGACFRIGHSMLSPQILRIDNDGKSTGTLTLQECFFNITLIHQQGIDTLLKGLASQVCQEVDPYLVDSIRNFLFNVTGGGMDLFAVNVQRARDHGLALYNQVRVALGLPRRTSFSQISSNPTIVARLAAAYDNVDQVELFVGALAEDHVGDAMVGETMFVVISDQFRRARDGDPNFYLNRPDTMADVATFGKRYLSEIIKADTAITNIQQNVFVVPSSS